MRGVISAKYCSGCDEIKPCTSFSRSKTTRDELECYCKACRKATVYAHRERQSSSHNVSQRRYDLKRRFNITLEQYDEMLAEQGGVCASCGSSDPGDGRVNFCVDHDHRCCPGKFTCGRCVRALLCNPCNTSLGAFSEDSQRIAALAEYAELCAVA